MGSYTLLACVLYLLHRHAVNRDASLWPLAPLFLVWANMHSLFLLGWGAMACFMVASWVRDRRVDRRLAGWCAVAAGMTLINPYGWRAPVFAVSLASRMREANVFAQSIGEFQSPLEQALSEQLGYYLVPALCFWLLSGLVLVTLVPLWNRRRLECLLLVALFLPLALSMIRNAPLLALTCLPGVAWALPAVPVARWLPEAGRGRRMGGRALTAALIAGSLLFSLRVVTDAYYVDARRLERFGWGWSRLELPLDVVAYVKSQGLSGPMLNHINFGGYLIWTLADPVFIDGRLEVMGEKFFKEYREALASPEGLEAAVQNYALRWIVFPHRLRPDLLGGLSRDRRWRWVYADELAALFVREGPGAERLVDPSVEWLTLPVDGPVLLDDLPGLDGGDPPSPVRHWISGFSRRRIYPARPLGLGLFHLSRGEPRRAAAQFRDAILRSGGVYAEFYGLLATALATEGKRDEAALCLRVHLSRLPRYRLEARREVQRRLDRLEESRHPPTVENKG
jgi:hypothetical protein